MQDCFYSGFLLLLSRLNSPSKVTRCFFIGVSLLLSLSARSSRKKVAVGRFADRFTLSVFLEWLSVPSLLRDAWRKPNWFPHREGCCEHFRPSPFRNPEWPSAVRPLCSRQPPQKLPRRCIVSVLCKFSSSYSQNSTFNNLYSFGSPLDNLRWVSQKWCAP